MSRPADNRAFLEQMGIDVWVTRGRVSPATPSADAVPEVTVKDPAETSGATVSSRARVEPAAAPAAATGPSVAPFRVLSLQKGPALILFEPADGKASHRFVSDVLSAASGLWGGELAALTFEWPQPGMDGDVGTQQKALGAFVAKQIDDQISEASDSIVLLASEVVSRLSEPPAGCILLPPLAKLMVQADLKRALWVELEGHQSG